MSNGIPVTVIILTFNEEINISECIHSLKDFDDVVVVDSGSTDRTLEILAADFPGVRVFSHPFEDFGQQRNWALGNTGPRHEWAFFVDADERCDRECVEAVREKIATPGGKVGFYLASRNHFLGRWIKHCTLYPSWQLRLLKLGDVRYRKEGHGQREVTDGPLGYIDKPYDHYGFSKGIADWIARHNVYSSNEVELIHRLRKEPVAAGDFFSGNPVIRRRFMKRIAARLGFRPLMRFVYLYVLRMGFLDGRPGLIFCLLRVSHEIAITAKLREYNFMNRGKA